MTAHLNTPVPGTSEQPVAAPAATATGRRWRLLDASGQPYESPVPGTFGGHRRGRRYGRLDCPAARRALARGGYARNRVFFADAATAIAAGYRPCAVCLPVAYQQWKCARMTREEPVSNAMPRPEHDTGATSDAPSGAPTVGMGAPEGIGTGPGDVGPGDVGGVVVGPDGVARSPWALSHPLLTAYYDTEWGTPIRTEQGLFERLSLEAFQSGLSWLTILQKRPAFRVAFFEFDPERVAAMSDDDLERLLANPGIVRNRAKVMATRQNAIATLDLRPDGGLADLIWSLAPATSPAPRTMAEVPAQSPESAALAAALRRHGFRFVGPTTVYALMAAVGMVDLHLVGSHRRGTVNRG